MRIAFYAPLKSPDHSVASGDRQLARMIIEALRHADHEVMIASRFRSFDAHGDARRQERLARLGSHVAQRLLARFRCAPATPDVWFTYHLYHKAPDYLGPLISETLRIPYVIAEASLATKQAKGPWARGYASSLSAIKAASGIVVLNPIDFEGIRKIRGPRDADEAIPPFIDVSALTDASSMGAVARERIRLITVAMMRPGAKLASYRLLADALIRIRSSAWELVVIGDGPARDDVRSAFAPLAERVTFMGAQPSGHIASTLRESDLFVWPAIDEAFGMAFLEAQACGLPVVAGDSGGVSSVVADGRTGILVPVGAADAFASAIDTLAGDAALRRQMASQAVAYVRETHDLPHAALRLDSLLRRIANEHAAKARIEAIESTMQ